MGDKKTAENSDARFMLKSVTPPANIKRNLTERDFAWNELTKGGPASGADPAIGRESGKAFYDFKDGQPFPYYVAPAAK